MTAELENRTIAILVANEGVEQVELTEPKRALSQAGATIDLIAPSKGEIQAFNHLDKADTFSADRDLAEASVSDYDALVLPGGVANPDSLRQNNRAVQFVRDFVDSGKPVAAICHAAWMLVEADAVRGRTLTSFPSLWTDIRNAGGTWIDEEVVTEGGIVTSRGPSDLPAFNAKIIEEVAEGKHARAAS